MISYVLSFLIAVLGLIILYSYLHVLLNNNKKEPWGRPLLVGGVSVFALGCAVYLFILFKIIAVR